MKRNFIFLAIMLMTVSFSFSQNSTKKWGFGINWAVIDYYGPDDNTIYKSGQTNFYRGPVNFTGTYNLVKPLNLTTSASFYDLKKINKDLLEDFSWKWDLGFQLRFVPLFGNDDCIFDPYLYVNGGVFSLDNEISPVVNGGLGLNIWLFENFAVSAQTGYNYGFDSDIFYETTFGVKFRFGSGTDSDGDGIVDSKDLCPNEPGVKSAQGCPDSDGDGIADANDKCPNDVGTPENDGCPVLDEERKTKVIQDLIFAAKNIQFETGSANIKSESYENLDNVVKILKLFPVLNLSIDGYTDNTGDPEFNKKLSQDRADAVKQYFVDKGIEDTRLTSTGHGIENPIASNDTPEGRSQNRRVELTIEN